MKNWLMLLILTLTWSVRVYAETTPDGLVNNDGTSIFQATNGQPVRQARTKNGEAFVTGKKSAPSVTVCGAGVCETTVKASEGEITGIQVFTSDTADSWLKLFNKSTNPVVGTNTPVKVIYIPHGLGAVLSFPLGMKLGTSGIAFAVTRNPDLLDATAITGAKTVVNIDFR